MVIGALKRVIAIVEEEAARLAEEFHRTEGPRGRRGHCEADKEIEERLREQLQKIVPCAFAGEETGIAEGREKDYLWMVDPHDGTFEFMSGRRGSAISVGLLKNNLPILGVVCSPLSADRGKDTIAWAEGAPAILRNGEPVKVDLSKRALAAGDFLFATASSASKPLTWAQAAAPARMIAVPSIAYRMARIAAGDGAATLSAHGIAEYDVAAGMALIRAAGGICVDAEGNELVLKGDPANRLSGVFAGGPEAVKKLVSFSWNALEAEPRREPRVQLGFPRKNDPARLSRATGALLGQVIGDSLGSRVEFKDAAEIRKLFPEGVRDLADGGLYHTIAGQPTDDSEMALALARSILKEKAYKSERVLEAYRGWLQTRPIDVGETTEKGLLGGHTNESESNGSLMRISPAGIWAAGDAAKAAKAARQDSALTHPNPVCVEACAGYAAAIAVGCGGGNRDAMLEAALSHSKGRARSAIMLGATSSAPADYQKKMGWVLIALQNAFYQLFHSDLETGIIKTVSAGGDTDTNAAIAGALLGAAHGREAIPSRWILPVLACRVLAEAGAARPRPMEYWPDDVLDIAEALLG
jgi:ADP-ribosyl-[dinitrogen reductase] hydrolase